MVVVVENIVGHRRVFYRVCTKANLLLHLPHVTACRGRLETLTQRIRVALRQRVDLLQRDWRRAR